MQRDVENARHQLAHETMEQRLAMAVTAFTQTPYQQFITELGTELDVPEIKPGWTVVVANAHDDLFIQQVATVPQQLLYADNSSFIDDPLVPDDYGFVSGINDLDDLAITNATRLNDSNITSDNYPVYDFTGTQNTVKTRFVLQHDLLNYFSDSIVRGGVSEVLLRGTLYYRQPGTLVDTTWTLTNDDPSDLGLDGDGQVLYIAGPTPATPGFLVPIEARLVDVPPVRAQVMVEVTWQIIGVPVAPRTDQVSPFTSLPSLDLRYQFDDETVFGSTLKDETGILPSASARTVNGQRQPAIFTLPNVAGTPGIVPGSLRGTISIDGGVYGFTTETSAGVEASSGARRDRLVFTGGKMPGLSAANAGTELILFTAGSKPKTVRGEIDFQSGTLSLYFGSWASLGGTNYHEQAPGPVSIDAEYFAYDPGVLPSAVSPPAGSLTVFAGHDITPRFRADLLPHGATINVDSPLIMRSTLTDGDSSFRASNVNLNARMLSNDRLDVGGSIAPKADIVRQAYAFPTLSATGIVTSLTIPPGLQGAGYNPVVPPAVILSPSQTSGVLARATVDRRLGSPTFGQVTGIDIIDAGSDYPNPPAAPPAITIAAPVGGGTTATAQAVVQGGRIVGVTILNPGSGYAVAIQDPLALLPGQVAVTAAVDPAGRIVPDGFGGLPTTATFASLPKVTIAPPTPQQAAALGAPVVVTNNSIASIPLLASGYGYAFAPQVWIAPPPENSDGIQATATATIDAAGRVIGITIVNAGTGYFTTDQFGVVTPFTPAASILAPFPIPAAEFVNFNAAVGANVYEIRVGDDAGTSPVRGQVFVSQTGSLTRDLFGGTIADSLFLQAFQSDVIIEGTVWVDKQSYLMQSTQAFSDLAPFLLTTTSPRTGASVGTIRGGTVGVTLANDAPTPEEAAVAFNDVDLRTNIDSLRIRAARNAADSPSVPFPYELRVEELNSIAIEAVAASSFPLTMSAKNNLLFNATLATAGDLNLAAGDLFTLSAPVSTTKGRIDVRANNLQIENSLQVTDAQQDDTRIDVSLVALGGNIAVAGPVEAVNNVSLRQTNRTAPFTYDYSNRTPAIINDNSTVSRSITVIDAFTFQDLDVAIDITHTFDSDLSAVLIAPDGTRIRLFTRVGGAGDNFTGTIFDSEAATPISAGTPPFTGRFRPQDSLAQLYNRDARGTWRLEVTDSATTDTGTLTNFTLSFTSPQPANGRISGTGRIVADRLLIDAEGLVGNADAAPGTADFYLRTNVNSLSGRAGAGLSIEELNDIVVTDLRAGGLVSLRADGVDPTAGRNAGRRALTAYLADVPAIDVSAPHGSVFVENNAPRTIIVGNANALRLGTAQSMVAAGDVTIRSTGGATRGEIFALDAPLAGSSARTARYRVTNIPVGTVYAPRNPGTTPSTLSGIGALNQVLGYTADAALRVNDRVLVSWTASPQANGVYTVTSLGGTASAWLLTRSSDSDTTDEMPSNTIVNVREGTDSGFYQLTYSVTPTSPFSVCSIGVAQKTLTTNIGSDDQNDLATFVVSTSGTTNVSAGSLGKMLLLRQQNDTSSSTMNPRQKMDFRFSSQVLTPIRLDQELPLITKPFTIDGNTSYDPPGSPGVNRPRITVDGSRISTTRMGNPVSITSANVEVNGLEVSGASAAGVTLSNMTVAGFTRGSAVKAAAGASNLLVNGMFLGSTELNLRVPNQFGLMVSNANNVTLLNSVVTANTKAGVQVDGSSTNVILVGNTIGVSDRDNNAGVIMASSGTNRVGVEPIAPLTPIPAGLATRVNDTEFTLPASYRLSVASIVPGLGVSGPGINGNAVVQSKSTDTRGVTTVVITGGTMPVANPLPRSGRTQSVVQFGNFVQTTLGSTSLSLPTSISPDSLYIGMVLSGTGIAQGSRITAIAGQTVTLSSPMTQSGRSIVTFPGANNGAPRNTLQNNLTGMELRSGSTIVVNTSILNNANDGIRITGGTNTIGRPDRTRSAFSNVIYGNGKFGIVFDVSGASSPNNSRASAVSLATAQVVRGNFLGVTSGNQTARTNTTGNIGLRYTGGEELLGGIYTPNSTTFIDPEGNQHNPTATRGGNGSSPPRRGVPPVPPRRR